MIIPIKFGDIETQAILTLAEKFNISPQCVVTKMIRSRIGIPYPTGGLSSQLEDEANRMTNGHHPDQLPMDISQHPKSPNAASTCELIPITEAARILQLSVSRMRTRSRKKGDPVRAAKSCIGKLKPMHFHRSMIEQVGHKS